MLNLPFFNRQRYIELTAYTPVKLFHDTAPIALSSKYPYKPNDNVNLNEMQVSFKTCSGYLSGLRNSATVPSPSEFVVEVTPQGVKTHLPAGNEAVQILVHDDRYFKPKDVHAYKLAMPWMCVSSKKDVKFVLARHILNTTPMIIPSGVLGSGPQFSVNCFFYMHRQSTGFKVDFRHQLLALWPLSDLPLHVNTVYDKQKFAEFNECLMAKPYFTNFMPRLSKYLK